MKVTLESTTKLVEVGDILCRVWEGHTESGIEMHAFIARVGVHESLQQDEFTRELEECRAPSAAIAAIPLRMIL